MSVFKNLFLLLFLFLLMIGCEDKRFVRVYDGSLKGTKIDTLHISTVDPKLHEVVYALLKKMGISEMSGAKYTLEVQMQKYAKHCNNPMTCSYDATYDGYVKIRLLKNMHPVYMSQQDYHGDFESDILENMVENMYDDLDLKR